MRSCAADMACNTVACGGGLRHRRHSSSRRREKRKRGGAPGRAGAPAEGPSEADGSAMRKCSACCACALADRSSILASPKMTYVSEAGDLKTSGLEMTNRMFLDYLIVTRCTPGCWLRGCVGLVGRGFVEVSGRRLAEWGRRRSRQEEGGGGE